MQQFMLYRNHLQPVSIFYCFTISLTGLVRNNSSSSSKSPSFSFLSLLGWMACRIRILLRQGKQWKYQIAPLAIDVSSLLSCDSFLYFTIGITNQCGDWPFVVLLLFNLLLLICLYFPQHRRRRLQLTDST